jgi:copper chaperone
VSDGVIDLDNGADIKPVKNMALKLTVPTLNSPEAAKALKETILTSEPDAKVEVDVATHTVTVEAPASEETFKQLITAAGHTIA